MSNSGSTESWSHDRQSFDNETAGNHNGALRNPGTALDFEPGREFERSELSLRSGSIIVFYTDGVSEAFNPQDGCYGEERFLANVGTFADRSAPVITAGLLQKVRAFVGSTPQSDDLAIPALRVDGGAWGEEGCA